MQLKKQPEKNSSLNEIRIPFKPEFFFRLPFQLLKLKAHCEDHNFTQKQ